jgi:hypothetical protein
MAPKRGTDWTEVLKKLFEGREDLFLGLAINHRWD